MNFQIIGIDKLTPAEYNPRKALKPGDPEFERIKRSIEQFGFVDPLVVNSDMTIIGGHQRWEILKHLGRTEVECVVVDLDKTRERALNVALNKITGEWDKEMLRGLIRDLLNSDFDVTVTGFDPDDFKNGEDNTEDDGFDLDSALKEPPVSQTGDIWQLGRHRLVCGDSTDPATFDALLEGRKVNLAVTDPPYNVDYESIAGAIQNDNMSDGEFADFLLRAFTNIAGVMAEDASIYVFHADTEGLNFRTAFDLAGFHLACVCIWAKQSLVIGRSPYQWKHEPVLFGWKKNGRHKWFADNNQSTFWTFDRPVKSTLHPTMKPIALCAYPMLNSTTANSLVLDPFGGSGSTLIAAEQIGRTCYMAEIDPKYCDVIVRRYIKQVNNDTNVTRTRDRQKEVYADIPKGGE